MFNFPLSFKSIVESFIVFLKGFLLCTFNHIIQLQTEKRQCWCLQIHSRIWFLSLSLSEMWLEGHFYREIFFFWCTRKVAWFVAHHFSECWEMDLWESVKYGREWRDGCKKEIISICIYNLISRGQSEMQSASLLNKYGSIQCNAIN